MTVPMVAFWVSTSGETPVTVAVSEIVPNSSVKLTRAVCCTCNSTSRVAVLKPSSSLFTVYVPGGNAGKSNRPTSLLTVVRVALVALLTTVTVAPGTTAPVESFTSPVMVPSVCATHGAQRSNHVSPANRVRRMGRLLSSKGLRPFTEIAWKRPRDRRQQEKPGARNENPRNSATSAAARLREGYVARRAKSRRIRSFRRIRSCGYVLLDTFFRQTIPRRRIIGAGLEPTRCGAGRLYAHAQAHLCRVNHWSVGAGGRRLDRACFRRADRY